MTQPSLHLTLHASIVLSHGLILGIPYARAINRKADATIVHAWRVAHASLPMGAILMLAVAALMPHMAIPAALAWSLAIALIVSGYAFGLSTTLAALSGQRGLDRDASPGWGRVVYSANKLGALTSLLAALLLVIASVLTLLGPSRLLLD